MASWQNCVTVEQFKDFGDFYAYCEVFNYHFENRPNWSNGVADVILAHNMYGIFDGHTNKVTSLMETSSQNFLTK